MDLLSVYSEVTEIITMVGGGDNGTQVSSLSLSTTVISPPASSGLCQPA
jgi:hypothetical protein